MLYKVVVRQSLYSPINEMSVHDEGPRRTHRGYLPAAVLVMEFGFVVVVMMVV